MREAYLGTYSHIITWMVVRDALIADVQEPNVSYVQNLVVRSVEEFCKVFCRLKQLTEPNHCWQVWLSSLEILSSQLDVIS